MLDVPPQPAPPAEPIETWEVIDGLESLLQKSLLVVENGTDGPRYRLLETVRQYARDRLMESGEAGMMRERHLEHFLAFAEESVRGMNGPGQKRWLDLLESDHDNMRSSLSFCADSANRGEEGLRLGGALWRFWWTRGHRSEGQARLKEALSLSRPSDRTAARALALNALGNLQWDDLPAARAALEESLSIQRSIGDRPAIARAMNDLAVIRYMQCEYVEARAFLEECLGMLVEAGNRRGEAICLSNIANQAFELGGYAEARTLGEKALRIARDVADPNAIAIVLSNLGGVLNEQGRFDEARAAFEETLAIRQELQDPLGIASARTDLCSAYLWEGSLTAARGHVEAALALCREHIDWLGAGFVLVYLGLTLSEMGEYGACLTCLDESVDIFKRLGDRYGVTFARWARGYAACAMGDFRAARTDLRSGLESAYHIGSRHFIARGLEGLVLVHGQSGDPGRAVQLRAAVQTLREAVGSRTPPIIHRRLEDAMATARKSLGFEVFEEALATGRAMGLDRAAATALEEAS